MTRSLLLLVIPSLAASAQPVLEFANVALMGKTFAVHLCTDPGTSDPSADGANVTWDFSSATLLMDAGSTTFMDPASTPFAASYPTSNLAQSVTIPGETSYSYFNLSGMQLDVVANGVGGSDESVFTDPKTPLKFPFAYPDYFIDYFTENGTDYSVSRAYMGYGTVILPTGTYTNVVKVASTSGSIDFYRSNPVEHLVNIDSDGFILVFGDAVTGVTEPSSAPTLSAYPSPTTDMVTIAGVRTAGTWELMDAQGHIHLRGRHVPGTLTLSLADLVPGRYVLLVRDATGRHGVSISRQ